MSSIRLFPGFLVLISALLLWSNNAGGQPTSDNDTGGPGKSISEIIDDGWKSFRSGHTRQAEDYLVQALARLDNTPGKQIEGDILDRLAVVYLAQDCKPEEVILRCRCNESQRVELLTKMFLRLPVQTQKASKIRQMLNLPNVEQSTKQIVMNSQAGTVALIRDSQQEISTGTVRSNSIHDQTPVHDSVLLKARIEHRERLNPLPEQYQIGHKVNVKSLQSLTPNNIWSKVRKAAAGTWTKLGQTTLWTYDYKTSFAGRVQITTAGHENRQQTEEPSSNRISITGFQMDKQGNIWTYDGGLTSTEENFLVTTIDTDVCSEVVNQTDDGATIRSTGTRFVISKMDNTINASFQVEEISVSHSISPDVIQRESSHKLFDQTGYPIKIVRTRSSWRRIKPFRIIDSYQGKNMKMLFEEYLLTHGLAHLIPSSRR